MKVLKQLFATMSVLAMCCTSRAHYELGENMVRRTNELTRKENKNQTVYDIVNKWDLENLTIAAVRATPVNWPLPMLNKNWDGVTLDLNATVELGVNLIKEAAANQARVVGFPEVWFPGYPKGLSFSEKDAAHLYMAQALIAPDGEILIDRHKLRPSAQERDLWTDGTLDQIYAVTTPIGRIGMLSCGEHTAPEVTFIMQSQTEDIHIGSWPLVPDFGNASLTYESAEVITALGRVYAILGDAVALQAGIGTATIFPAGSSAVWSQVTANASFNEIPLVYQSFNATEFSNTTYNTDGEMSWGSLQGINQGFPKYIPQKTGEFVAWHQDLLNTLYDQSVV
ncbi:aliphatic nitrilase [Penicillium brevicompactum]